MLDIIDERASELNAKQAADAFKALSIAKGINIDKSQLLRGRPTEIKATVDVMDLLQSLQREYPGVVEVEGIEIPDEDASNPAPDDG